MAKDTTDLPPEEAYVVTQLRAAPDVVLRQDPNNRPLMCAGPLPVCTFGTLFRMLGRGVLVLDPTAAKLDRYGLSQEWK